MGSRQRTVSVVALVVVGALLGALAVGGQVLYSYYVLRPWLHHPLIFGVSGCVALAIAWVVGVRQPLVKWVGVALMVLVSASAVSIAWLVSGFGEDLVELSRHPAPDGRMELVVYEGHNIIDPTWELRVFTRNGLLSKESDLGCVNADLMSLTRIDWVGQRTLRAELSRGEPVDINLDASGRPDTTLHEGC